MAFGSKTSLKAVLLALVATAVITAVANDGGVELTLKEDAVLGPILVDSAGMTLYLFVNDQQGDSTCSDACTTNWPPLVADGEVTVGDGLDPELLGTVVRMDGSEQVTYGGWPLYTFARDTEPGSTAGQGLNDAWFAVGPDGAAAASDSENQEASGETEADDAEGEQAAGGDDADVDALMAEGARVFARICADCHGANGDEARETHVAILADNSRLENERLVLRRVIHGSGYMPAFGSALSDREVAAVATFVRNSWGNEYGLVGEEAAAAAR